MKMLGKRNSGRFISQWRRSIALSLAMVWTVILTTASYHIQQMLPLLNVNETLLDVPPTVASTNSLAPPFVVAYAVTLLKCNDDFQIDASLILQHSIHQISSRNPDSGSSYDYKLYAMVPTEDCAKPLEDAGFEVVVVDSQVKQEEIRRGFEDNSDEFIKLLAYTLPEDIVVHVDTDFAFYKPMDDLFDALRYDKSSPTGRAVRSRILLEQPEKEMPDRIEAFLTRYQTGFIVARSDPIVFEEMLEAIREGNHTPGNYGLGENGATNMQGFVAYFYDKIRPNTAVELNQCRYNHMGKAGISGIGGCRDGGEECEDCRVTVHKDVHSVHYTMCHKPWQCMAQGESGGKLRSESPETAIDTDIVDLTQCLALVKMWHDLRTDLEAKLLALTGDVEIANGSNGTYREDVFNGHCDGDGTSANYIPISTSPEMFRRMHELYSARL